MELTEDGEKLGGTAKARQDFPQSVTADSTPALIWLKARPSIRGWRKVNDGWAVRMKLGCLARTYRQTTTPNDVTKVLTET